MWVEDIILGEIDNFKCKKNAECNRPHIKQIQTDRGSTPDWVLPYLGMVGRFRGDDPPPLSCFGDFQCDDPRFWDFQYDLRSLFYTSTQSDWPPLSAEKNCLPLSHLVPEKLGPKDKLMGRFSGG